MKLKDALKKNKFIVTSEVQSSFDSGPEGLIDNLKLVRGRSNRSWRSEDQVLKAFSKYIAEHEESKLKKDDLYTKKLMSPNQIETNLPDEVMEAMVELVYKPEGKVTVAHKSDKRTAIDSADEAAKDWEDEI